MKTFKFPLRGNTKGAGLVEYGILAGLVAVVSIGAVLATGNEVRDTFVAINSTLDSNLSAAFQAQEAAGPSDPVHMTILAGESGANIGNCSGEIQGCGTPFGTASPITLNSFTIYGVNANGSRLEIQFGGDQRTALANDLNYGILCGAMPDYLDFADQTNIYLSDDSTFLNIPTTETPFTNGEETVCNFVEY